MRTHQLASHATASDCSGLARQSSVSPATSVGCSTSWTYDFACGGEEAAERDARCDVRALHRPTQHHWRSVTNETSSSRANEPPTLTVFGSGSCSSPGKWKRSSRLALAGLSLPWTAFIVLSVPKAGRSFSTMRVR